MNVVFKITNMQEKDACYRTVVSDTTYNEKRFATIQIPYECDIKPGAIVQMEFINDESLVHPKGESSTQSKQVWIFNCPKCLKENEYFFNAEIENGIIKTACRHCGHIFWLKSTGY